MRPRSDPEVAAWLAKASGDLIMASRAMEGDLQLCDQACYHSQQAGEKAFKAMLVALEMPVPRTHDLVALLHGLIASEPSWAGLLEVASELTKFSTSPRYPSFLAPETPADATRAMDLARQLLARVEAVFGG